MARADHRAAVALGVEDGELAQGAVAPALHTGDGRVRILHPPQGIKSPTAFLAGILVDRHWSW